MTPYNFFRKIYEKYYKWKIKKYIPHDSVIKKDKDQVIVSLTSFPPRLNVLPQTLKSLLLQTEKPDRIIVWFGEDTKEEMLTEELKSLKKSGIEYRFMKGNLKPHKKYFYAMMEFPKSIIITVDDDVIYDKNMIRTLLETHKIYPDSVCARRIHRIQTKNHNKEFEIYNNWIQEYKPKQIKPDNLNFATGIGGVLYPPNALHPDAFDEKEIMELCLNADDIWLKIMEVLQGTKVVWAKCYYPHPIVVEDSQETCLNAENVSQNRNDLYWNTLVEHYRITVNKLNCE